MGVRSLWQVACCSIFCFGGLAASFCDSFVKPRIKVLWGLPESKGEKIEIKFIECFSSVRGSPRILGGFNGMVNRAAMLLEQLNKKPIEKCVSLFPYLFIEEFFCEAAFRYLEDTLVPENPVFARKQRGFLNRDVWAPLLQCERFVKPFISKGKNLNMALFQDHLLTYFFHEVAHADYLANHFSWEDFVAKKYIWTRKIRVTRSFLKALFKNLSSMKQGKKYELLFIWYRHVMNKIDDIYTEFIDKEASVGSNEL